jgi:chitosanase
VKTTSNTALALAATAVTVIAVGTVAVVTPSGGHDSPAAVSVTGTATAGGSAADSGSTGISDNIDSTDNSDSSGSPTGGYSSSGSIAGPQGAAGQTSSDHSATGSTSRSTLPSKTTSQPSSTHPATPSLTSGTTPAPAAGLDDPRKKEIAMELVSSAENSSLNWRAQYRYIEDIQDGRGYTGGIIGFCSGTGDMLQVVQHYAALEPGNVLAKYLGALKSDNGSATHSGLDPNFTKDWATAASDPKFQQAQDDGRDAEYFNPAVDQAKADGLGTLGQFIYYDAIVMHGPGSDSQSFGGIRSAALRKAKPPSQGGDQIAYLNAFLDARIVAMKADPSHQDTSRIDTGQRLFVKAGNVNLDTPLHWSTYGDAYTIN